VATVSRSIARSISTNGGRLWAISVWLQSPVGADDREIAEQILTSFRFDGVPAGDKIWAIGEALKHLPPEAHPDEFVREGGNTIYNVTARKEGKSVVVTFTTQEPGQEKRVWEFRVTETGEVAEIDQDSKQDQRF
jgi:hypothetical protein